MKYKKTALILSILMFNLLLIYGMCEVSDICTNKDDSNSNLSTSSFEDTHILEWDITWNGVENEIPRGIALDSLGNIYITGLTQNASFDDAIFLARFNNLGQLQWNRTFDNSR